MPPSVTVVLSTMSCAVTTLGVSVTATVAALPMTRFSSCSPTTSALLILTVSLPSSLNTSSPWAGAAYDLVVSPAAKTTVAPVLRVTVNGLSSALFKVMVKVGSVASFTDT
ncbi:hypothetical protein D3C79_732500 [compost metagenome]